jgi:CheY-like chemotaxis protein
MLTVIRCGPYKLSIVLNACLHQYDNPQMPASTSPAADQGSPTTRKHRFSQFGPKLGLYPPALAIRTKSSSSIEQVAVPVIQAQSPPQPVQIPIDGSVHSQIEQAKDGQQALDSYKDAPNKFDLILMDISMPVMDGMTATRLIRNYEKEKELPPSHIIALTGLTSASARLEAWTSGVDDFLTKPVDFKKLESLMAAGRGGEGTGFTKESTPAAPA